HFRLSRNTIVSIYERLTNEGLVTSRRGSGTFVGAPGKRRPVHSQRLEGHSVELNEKIRRGWTDGSIQAQIRFLGESAQLTSVDAIEMRPALVDLNLFPLDEFRRCMAKTLRKMERMATIRNSVAGSPGNLALREAIADHATLMRAFACDSDEVVI